MRSWKLAASVFGMVALGSCDRYDPPADHTIRKGGFLHKPGRDDPMHNCVECHGPNLEGGKGPSCKECHEQE